MRELNSIYVEGFKDLPNGDKELITVTIETNLALKMLTDYLGLEYALEEVECPQCKGLKIGHMDNDGRVAVHLPCNKCKGTGKVQSKPIIRKKK